MLGVFTDLLAFLPSITYNPLLAAMYGGLAQGIAIGLFVRFSMSSGGTELLGRVIHHGLPQIGIPAWIAIFRRYDRRLTGAIVMKIRKMSFTRWILIFYQHQGEAIWSSPGLNGQTCATSSRASGGGVPLPACQQPPRCYQPDGKGMYSGRITPRVLSHLCQSHQPH